ncbi:MAG: aminotransferase class V-fold PLP-dependent enzyme [Clostridia bacterium]|nr:aminotransferase class V-fold PLP-dependent enzyme [Clostridia bacterium]
MLIYFDNAATTKPSRKAIQAYIEGMQNYGNPSSTHTLGVRARQRLEESRKTLAAAVGCKTEEFYFTASGTEANNIAIHGLWNLRKRKSNRVLMTDSEHPSVAMPVRGLEAQGAEVVCIPTRGGKLDTDFLKNALKDGAALVCVMLANNETGAVYDIKAVRDLIKKSGTDALLHCDAVQGFLKAPKYKQALKAADSASFSAHKVHAPCGTGGLMLSSKLHPPALMLGGGQEKGLRSGTENVAGAMAFAVAAQEYAEHLGEIVSDVRGYLIEELKELGNIGFNVPENHIDEILNISFRGVKSETALNYLSSQGIYLSASSACSSAKAENSVLAAYGLDKAERECALRIGISHYNSPIDAIMLSKALKEAREKYGRI